MEKIYNEKIAVFLGEERQLKQRSNLCLYGKLLSFAFFAFGIYQCIAHYTPLWVVATIGSFILYITLCKIDARYFKRISTLQHMQQVCTNEIGALKGDYTPFPTGDEYVDIHHEFSFDLDVFGKNSLYHRINRTITPQGSRVLAHKFTHLQTEREAIIRQQDAITELTALLDWRIRFLGHPPLTDHLQMLSTCLRDNRYSSKIVHSRLPEISVGITVLTLILGAFSVLPMNIFGMMVILQLLLATLVSKQSLSATMELDTLHKEFTAYHELLNEIHEQDFQSPLLLDLKRSLFEGPTNSLHCFEELTKVLNLFDQRRNIILNVLFNGIGLYDIFIIRRFIRWRQQYVNDIQPWMDTIGEFDALTSLAGYAYNHPHNHPAEVLDASSDAIIEAHNVYHPFLDEDKAVPNDFVLKKRNVAIVTGANMAGKSTFLRTIGITYILANNGVPVCASSFRFSIVALFSSMRTTDNLSEDISYFNAELIRLKQLIQYVKEQPYTLIILDEILKGTNSKDKLEGSIMFLKAIAHYPMSGLIATHDLELARLEEKAPDTYRNYCFEIELSDNIIYTYKIHPGVARNLNASYLLGNILKELES